MGWAHVFVDNRRAAVHHRCSRSDDGVGPGDHYLREAVPPWVYEDRDEGGGVIRYSVGFWLVFKSCTECRHLAVAV